VKLEIRPVLEIRYYLAPDGRSPFEGWFSSLDAPVAAKVTVAIARLDQGNLSNVKGVGEGVLEYRINFGPGYRVYFGRDGNFLPTERSGDMTDLTTTQMEGGLLDEFVRQILRRAGTPAIADPQTVTTIFPN
jgi:putative addiction module killer protein